MITGENNEADTDLARAVSLIRKSKKPLVIAGTLAIRKRWGDKLSRLSLPVFCTAAAKGVINEKLPQAGGVYTAVGGPLAPETQILPEADLFISLGLRHNEVLAVKPFDRPAIHLDPLGNAKGFGFNFNLTMKGTSGQIDTLLNALSEKTWGLDLIETAFKKLAEKLFAVSFLPAHVYARIAGYFGNEARLVLDTGNFCTIAEHVWQVPCPSLYLASGQGRSMGVGIPLGVGAAIYDPSVPTIVFTGDGGVGMFVAEVKLAVQHKLPLLIVLLSDSFLGTIRSTCLQKGFTHQPTAIYRPSWRRAMEGLGLPAERVTNISGLEKALAGWSQTAPLFLEIPFDPDNYQRMTDGLR
jgi:acetolactate synthase-1/2/3 large subunit